MEPHSGTADSAALTQMTGSAQKMSGWLKFLGILNVIFGIPAVIVLVGILNIWLGVLLYQAGDAAQAATAEDLVTVMDKLKTYFIVYGVLAIIGLVIAVAYMIVLFVIIGVSLQDSGLEI